MGLRLEYSDKYRLWNALVRGHADRLFIPTTDRLTLGDPVAVKIYVGDTSLPVVVEATLIGKRAESLRFAQGVYVRISDEELDKFRRFLELQPSRGVFEHTRAALRVHHEFPVRFAEPQVDEVFSTTNISEKGLFCGCPAGLHAGQRVSLYVVLDDLPLRVEAEVAWVSELQQVTGLKITDVTDHGAKRLREAIELVRERKDDDAPHRPILVADDDPAIRKMLTQILSKNGYDVFQSRDGDETLDMVRDLHPDLVFLDILMPGTDGAEICKVMRADAELADIKVIFVSALGDDILHSVADEAGANDYMAKPLRIPRLLELVAHYLA